MKKTATQIKVGIADEKKVNREFIEKWKQAERQPIHIAEERLYFADAKTLLSVLSNCRLGLLYALHQLGDTSIRALSHHVKRDYKNVFQDVQVLKRVGLMVQTESKLISVPWDKIQTEIDLAA